MPYTQLASFLEAVNFAVHVLGLPTQPPDEPLITPFIKSVMDKASLNRPRRKQARPLTTNEVVFLEETLKNPGRDIRDRYAIGAFLFALYSRSRWSDLRNVDSYMLDVDYSEQKVSGFLEFRTSTHKTAAQTARHGLPMPLVAPLWGLTSPPWGLAFKRVADEARLEFDSDFRGPLLPAPKIDGSWGMRTTTSDEASKWLLEVIRPHSMDLNDVSSHSLKATPLSWLAKGGGDPTDRQILGHHSAGKGALETYSRDQLSAPLRAFEEILRQIRIGALCPDRTRSGHVQKPTKSDCRDSHVEEQEAQDQPESSSSSTTSSSNSSSSDSESEESFVALPADPLPRKCWGVSNMYQHTQSKIIHLENAMGSRTFFCGMHATAEHKVIDSSAFLDIRQCKRCVKAILASDQADL